MDSYIFKILDTESFKKAAFLQKKKQSQTKKLFRFQIKRYL